MKFRIIIALVLLVVASIVLFKPIVAYTTYDTVRAEVTHKERNVNNGESMYLVFTTDGTYKNVDSIWYLKFNSSDVYGDVKVGSVCEFGVYGFRFPIFSWYRNIVNVKCDG